MNDGHLIEPGGRQRQIERGGDVLRLHGRTELPGDNEAREVVEHGGEIVPAPARDLEIGEVGLPELVGRRGLVLERLGRFDDDVGWAGDKIVGTVRNLVCGAIVTPMEGAYGNQERDPGRFAGGA